MNKLILLFFIFSLGFISCSKKYVDVKPKLELTVCDANDRAVAGVNVSLYETESDWKNKTNTVTDDVTDSNGIVLFEGLEPKVYYFSAVKGSLSNDDTTVAISSALKENVKAKIQIHIK